MLKTLRNNFANTLLTIDRTCNTIYYIHMRSVVNISLPVQMNEAVEKIVAVGNYSSKSEFFRSLLRMWMEGRLADKLEKSRDELKTGKGKLLRSLTDLR